MKKYSLHNILFGKAKKRKNKYSLKEALITGEDGTQYNISDELMQQIIDDDATSGTRAQRAAAQRAAGYDADADNEQRTIDGASRAHVLENQREFREIAQDLGGADAVVSYIKGFVRKGGKKSPPISPFSTSAISFFKSEPFRKAVVDVLYKDETEERKAEVMEDLADGKKNDAITGPDAEPLKNFLSAAAGRVEEATGIAQAREGLANVRASLVSRFSKSLPKGPAEQAVKKIVDLTEDLAAAGMGANFFRKTIEAVAQLDLADMNFIKTETFPTNTMNAFKKFPAELQNLFDIADGSRGQNLGRGEIGAYFHFENIKTPDLASGVFDLETTDGVSMHVKHLTGDRERGLNETIPGKKDAVLDAFKDDYKKQSGDGATLTSDSFLKKFKGNARGSNLAISNIVAWLNSSLDASLPGARRKAAAKLWVEDNIPLLNDACHSKAIDGAGVLFFKGSGDSIEYRYVEPGDKNNVFFERTDKDGVGITMNSAKALNVSRVLNSSAFTAAFP